ncbi:LysE family transporter, partial [Serratia rubidaea]|uniref:LysE family transporter n=1 Tax=Serratia rubidaea TaxID=61652 RepID=UPI001BAFC230
TAAFLASAFFVSASAAWFFALALLAAWLSPYLKTQLAQRTINILVGLVMWAIAAQLAWHGMQ